MGTVDYFVVLACETSDIRALTHLVALLPLSRVMRDRFVAGELTTRYVLADDLWTLDQPGVVEPPADSSFCSVADSMGSTAVSIHASTSSSEKPPSISSAVVEP